MCLCQYLCLFVHTTCVYVCVCMHACISVAVFVFVCAFVHMRVSVSVLVSVCVLAYVCVCIYVYLSLHVCVYMYMNASHIFFVTQPCTKSLQEINLSNNRVGDYGIMMAKLSLLANRSLLKLVLCNTRITCEGAQ